MKSLHVILTVTLVLTCSQCTSSLDLLDGLLGTVTKTVDNVVGPLLNTTTTLVGTVANNTLGTVDDLTGAVGVLLGTLGRALGSATNLVTTVIVGVTGGLVQIVGDVEGGLVNELGVLVSGALGLTTELLKELQLFDESKWPSLYVPLEPENLDCIKNFVREFQTFNPETVRLAENIIAKAEYFYNFMDYCRHPDTDTEIVQCMTLGKQTLANNLNNFAVDAAVVNYKLIQQWVTMIETQVIKCIHGD